MSAEPYSFIGADIYTMDGDNIGKVREVKPGFFKVHARISPDYWLSMDSVASGNVVGDRVILTFPTASLDDEKLDQEDFET